MELVKVGIRLYTVSRSQFNVLTRIAVQTFMCVYIVSPHSSTFQLQILVFYSLLVFVVFLPE